MLSSRKRYLQFVEDYKHRRLDDTAPSPEPPNAKAGNRRQYLREYMRWLWLHRSAVLGFFTLALLAAGLQMLDPLFMRYIIDQVLLNADLSPETRISRLSCRGIKGAAPYAPFPPPSPNFSP